MTELTGSDYVRAVALALIARGADIDLDNADLDEEQCNLPLGDGEWLRWLDDEEHGWHTADERGQRTAPICPADTPVEEAARILANYVPMETKGHLTAPWRAVLADDLGFVLVGLDHLDPGCGEVTISIRRASALPIARDAEESELPASARPGDVIALWDHVDVDGGDPSTDAAARWAQAQAMADGLNAAAERGETR